MRHVTTAIAAALASLLLAACAKNEDTAATESPAAEESAPVEAPPAEAPPTEEAPPETPPSDDDAEQSGGDKVKPN